MCPKKRDSAPLSHTFLGEKPYLYHILIKDIISCKPKKVLCRNLYSPTHRAWSGYVFEQLYLHHISGIKQRLGISGVATSVSSWVQTADKEKGIVLKQNAQAEMIQSQVTLEDLFG